MRATRAGVSSRPSRSGSSPMAIEDLAHGPLDARLVDRRRRESSPSVTSWFRAAALAAMPGRCASTASARTGSARRHRHRARHRDRRRDRRRRLVGRLRPASRSSMPGHVPMSLNSSASSTSSSVSRSISASASASSVARCGDEDGERLVVGAVDERVDLGVDLRRDVVGVVALDGPRRGRGRPRPAPGRASAGRARRSCRTA